MAGDSYISTRPPINQFPVPDDWTTISDSHFIDTSSGFEAVYFTNGNKIVISFAGTDSGDILGDMAADAALCAGFRGQDINFKLSNIVKLQKDFL
jgi:hypothetical protein